jgi:maleamate amidohydrolase
MTGDALSNYRGVFDGKLGFGRSPALLVIDFIAAYTTPDSPLFAPDAGDAARQTAVLYAAAKQASVPVIFTRVVFNGSGTDGGLFVRKIPILRELVEGAPLAAFLPELQPADDDVVVTKQYASAFFGTSLASTLVAAGRDTVILTGVSTSGCIRATAVDALQHGFRAIVPRECVADRHAGPHEANLFDIDAKYGDVLSLEAVISALKQM